MKLKLLKLIGLCLVALLLAESVLVDATGEKEGNRGEGRKKNGRKRKNKDRQRQKQIQVSEDGSSHFSEDGSSSSLSGSFLDSSPVIFADGSHDPSYSQPQHHSSSHSDQISFSSFEDHPGHPGHISSGSSSSEHSGSSSSNSDDSDLLLSIHPGDHHLLPPPPPPTHTCEPIRIDICRNIGYNVTSMPNFVGHELQADGELQLNTFLPLINYGCSSQLKFFLCSVYVPMCTEKVPVTIGPCRPLCESVRGRCAPVLEELGFPWPEALNCSKFVPTNSVDQMCMDGPPPDYVEAAQPPPTIVTVDQIRVNHHPPIYQNSGKPVQIPGSNHLPNGIYHQNPGAPVPVIPHQHQRPPHELIINTSGTRTGGSYYPPNNQPQTPEERPKEGRKANHNRNNCDNLIKSDQYVFLESSFLLTPQSSSASSSPVSSADHPQCVPKCGANILFSEENKQFVDYWTAIWAALALLSCTLTLAAFFAHSSSSSTLTPGNPGPCILPSGKVLPNTTSSSTCGSFRYPERAVVYIAVCSGLSALAYLYRAAVGRQSVSCHLTELAKTGDSLSTSGDSGSTSAWLLISEAAYNPHCTASFLLLYYFGMAAAAWFSVLAVTLAAAVAFRLRLSDLSAHRSLYHCFAWCLPAAQTLAALVLRAVDGDELTGVCFVGGQSRHHLLLLVLVPNAGYLGLGVVLLLGALLFARLVTVKDADQCGCTSGSDHPFLEMTSSQGEPISGEGLLFSNGNALMMGGTEELPLTAGLNSETRSETAEQSGCSNFCRRFRRASTEDLHHSNGGAIFSSSSSAFSSGDTNHQLRHQATNGSGHSLLLPSKQPSNHFCTVSSTASYSSSATSSSSATGSGGHSGNLRGSSVTSKPQYGSLIDSASSTGHRPALQSTQNFTRAASKRLNNSRTPAAAKRSRHYHLRRNLAFSSASSSKGSHLFISSTGKNFSTEGNSKPSEFDSETAAALIRSAIFALFYLLPAAFVTAGHAYEYFYRDSWIFKPEALRSSSEVAAMTSSTPNFEVFNMRLFMSLVIGINTGIWILTAKSPIKGSWWWSSSSSFSSSSNCLFWRCFVKKGVPIATTTTSGGGSSVVSSVAPTIGSTVAPVSSSQQMQMTLTVYPMMSLNPYQQQQQQQVPLQLQPQLQNRRPLPETYYQQQQQQQQLQLTNSHLLQQSQKGFLGQQNEGGNFFFLSDLAVVPGSGGATGSTATNSTLLSSLNSNSQQQQQQFYDQTGVQSLWSDSQQQQQQQQIRAPGNETAV